VLSNVDAGEWFSGLLRRAQRWKSQPDSVSELALSVPLVGLHVNGWLPAAEAQAPLGGSAVPIRACGRGREAKVCKVLICAPPLLEHLCYRITEVLRTAGWIGERALAGKPAVAPGVSRGEEVGVGDGGSWGGLRVF